MTRSSIPAFALSAALASFAIASPAAAATPFDGSWSVQVTAKNGNCNQAYHLPINVVGGQVSYAGMFSVAASGEVAPTGALNVQMAHNGDVVNATGVLDAQWGSGNWTSQTLACSGVWVAKRS